MLTKQTTLNACLRSFARLPGKVNKTASSLAAAVFLFIGVGVLSIVPATSSVTPDLTFSINPSKATQLQVYFDRGEGYTEEQSVKRSLKAEQTAQVNIDLPPSTRSVRIDPSMAPGDVLIGDLRWRNQDKSIALQRKITSTRGGTIQIQADGLLFSSDSSDPQIVVAVPNSSEVDVDWSYRVLRGVAMTLIAISVIGLIFLWVSVPVLSRTLSLQLGVVITLVFLIATKSDFGSHPDEGSHKAAASYYQKHWLTKNVDVPEMRATLISTFGTSYLYLKDCVYFLAGKWGALLSGSGADQHVVYRWFNVALLAALLIALSGKSCSSVCFLGAVCFTPQVWYIFSYFNGDGLSFAAAVTFCCYFAAQKDAIVRFFAGQGSFGVPMTLFTALAILLVFTRLHYLLVLPFVLAVAFVLVLEKNRGAFIVNTFARISAILAVLFAAYALFYLKEEYINGFERTPRIEAIKEKMRPPEANREIIVAGGANPHLFFLKDTGVGLVEMAVLYRWFPNSYESFIARFGPLTLRASPAFYTLSTLFVLLPVAIVMIGGLLTGPWWQRAITALAFAFVGATLLQSLLYSWLDNYQAQGRYLFAVIPMVATAIALRSKPLPLRPTLLWLVTTIAINLYGFYAYAVKPMVF